MTTRLKGRRREVARVVGDVARWGRASTQVLAVVLVGSYARGAERMSSDVDLVVLADDPDFVADSGWFAESESGAQLVRLMRWGPIRERRCRLRSGLHVELGIGPVSWASVPLNAGTRRVLADGHRVLYDDGVLHAASAAVR